MNKLKRNWPTRPLAVGSGILLAAASLATASPWIAPESPALAQAQATATVFAIQVPPPVPGLTYPDLETGTDSPADLLPAATPSPPGDAGTGPAEGAVTANLGGSDVAVTSEGGSYEVDAPKRRAKRAPRPSPEP